MMSAFTEGGAEAVKAMNGATIMAHNDSARVNVNQGCARARARAITTFSQ